MGTPYIISHVVLEEHRHNVERGMPNPDWPDAVPARRLARFAGLRQCASDMLLALARRIAPADGRSRSGNRGTLANEAVR